MKLTEEKRDGLLSLAYTMAPELHQRPLYIVSVAELGIIPTAAGCQGMVGPAFDLACQQAIGDRWRGRGWCIMLASASDVEGIVIHEMAHILDGTMPWIESLNVSHELVANTLRQDLAQHFTQYRHPPTDPWHGLCFHRALIHLRYRAQQVGVFPGWHELGAQSRCPMHLLAGALGNEPARRSRQPFANIMGRPCPPRFRKLWNRCHVASTER